MTFTAGAVRPLVSVGLPTYSRASSLPRAIASILGQSYERLELVISDNASTDETETICREAQQRDRRVKYIRQPVNQGPTKNFQEVLRRSTGEFYMWLSDDDWLEPNYIAACAQTLLDDPECSSAVGRVRFVKDGVVTFTEPPTNLLADSPVDRVLAYFAEVDYNGAFYGLMRRADISRVRFANVFAGDWLVMGGVACLGKVRTVEECGLMRSTGGGSRSVEAILDTIGRPPSLADRMCLKIGGVWLLFGAEAFRDIVWRNPAYSRLSLRQRIGLGIRVADRVWSSKPMPGPCFHYPALRNRLRRVLGPERVGTGR